MNKKHLSILSLGIVVCMLAMLLAGCTTPAAPDATPSAAGEATKAPDAGTTEPPATEYKKVSFTQYWNMASHNVAETEILTELKKRMNVDVKYEVPQSDDGQQMTIMMSSGQLPEIITTPRTNPNVSKLIDAKAVYCINDLMAQYAPDMEKNIEPEYFNYHKYKDGKNYYWTNYIYTEWVLNHDTWPKVEAVFRATSILTDVYEGIGKPDVSTPEAYLEMLKAVKEKYPDMTTYGLSGYPSTAMAAGQSEGSLFINSDSPSWGLFGEWGLSQYDVADGKVTSVIRNPKFYDMVSFLNDIHLAGLLDPTSFTDNGELRNTKIDNGQLAVYHGTIGNHTYTEGVKYTPLPYFETVGGEKVDGFYNKSGAGWLATMVNSKTTGDVLEGVMRFLAYQVAPEGRQLVCWGIEGRHWEWDPAYNNELPKKTALWDNMEDPSDHTKKWGFWQTRALHDQYYCNSLFERWTPEREEWYGIYGDRMKLDIFDGVRNPPMDDSAEGVILAKLVDHSFSYYPKLVTASSKAQLKTVYDEFVAKCDTDGLKTLENYWTERYALFN